MERENRLTILIASYLEPEHVERIRQLDKRFNVVYEPELLRPPRYPADHVGAPKTRSVEETARWREWLRSADILFDFDLFDETSRTELPEAAPSVRWIQATSSGIGQFVHRMGYDKRMPKTVFTTARGVHARPLGEFCIMAMLALNKGIVKMVRDKDRKHWERYAGTDLEGRTVGVIGMGSSGGATARLAKAFGMTVVGTDVVEKREELDRFFPLEDLHEMLALTEYLILCVPHTPRTEKLIGAEELAILPPGAVVINIARGAVVDETALIQALRSGHIRGAALDVFEVEPLPPESPLWEMPNVIISPHSASTSDRENERLTDLFCENLHRFLAGDSLLNVLNTDLLY